MKGNPWVFISPLQGLIYRLCNLEKNGKTLHINQVSFHQQYDWISTECVTNCKLMIFIDKSSITIVGAHLKWFSCRRSLHHQRVLKTPPWNWYRYLYICLILIFLMVNASKYTIHSTYVCLIVNGINIGKYT